jgi:peptidoglycan/LPS O-acetylase OafA/YrhL
MISTPYHGRGYMPQLDALRAIAVAAVAWSHWAPHELHGGILWGPYGVKLFFVLSGFLITAILLDCRQAASESPGGGWFALRSFYVRRFLRLMPLYYATLLLAALCALPPVRETLGWTLSYTANFYFYLRGNWNGVISHFWSLAVEEQFYLVWPWIILFVPARWLKATVIGTIAASAGAWLVLAIAGISSPVMVTLPWLCCDALGLGALLALIDDRAQRARLASLSLQVGLPSWLAAEALTRIGYGHPLLFWLQQQSVLLVFAWLIERAATGFRGPVGRLLENRALVGLGTISYGLYVIHNFAPHILGPLARTLDLPRWVSRGLPTRLLLLSLITIALAWVSWQVMEQPIQRWKTLFPYRKRKVNQNAVNDATVPASPSRRAA